MSAADVDDKLAQIFKDVSLSSDSDDNNIFKTGVIPPLLANLECPFSWKYNFIRDSRDIMDVIEQKLEIREEVVPRKSFVLNLILCYEYAKNGYLEAAMEKQMECDDILDENCNVEDGPVMGCGLRHISLACKCFLLYASNSHDKIEKSLVRVVPFDDMKTRDKASFLCMKGAYCAEYGYKGIKESVALLEEAVAMDKEYAEWPYMLGRSLSRLRRLENRSAIPDQRELKALECAAKLSNNAEFMVMLAQSYRETARSVFFEKKKDFYKCKPFCDVLNEKSADLYRKVLEQENNTAQVLGRCALGLIKLPEPWKDLVNARKCILKALYIAPKNPMLNHTAGTYYSFVGDYKQAIAHFGIASALGVYGAEMDLITLKRRKNKAYTPVADLERLLYIYKEKPRLETTLCFLGAYHYIAEKDFKKALEYWIQVIEMDIMSVKLRAHYDVTSDQKTVMNINKIVVMETVKLLKTGNISESERESYEKVINKYKEHYPDLVIAVDGINISMRGNKVEDGSWKKSTPSKSGSMSGRSGRRDDTKNSERFGSYSWWGRSEKRSSKYQAKPCDSPRSGAFTDRYRNSTSSSSFHHNTHDPDNGNATSSRGFSQRSNSGNSRTPWWRKTSEKSTLERGRGFRPHCENLEDNTCAVRKNVDTSKFDMKSKSSSLRQRRDFQ